MSTDNQKEEDNLNKNQPKTESSVSEKKDDKTIEEKLKDSEDRVLRALAEIENQRRRFEKEIKDAFEFGSFNFAKESLSILDNLHRAKEAINNDETLKTNKDLDKFISYIDVLNKDLTSIFEKNRIIKISTDKKKFDPNLHQAMSELENDDVEPGTILMEIQAGYMLGERLLRPALVSVAKKKGTKKAENNEKK